MTCVGNFDYNIHGTYGMYMWKGSAGLWSCAFGSWQNSELSTVFTLLYVKL
jgi:hypothetical protein